MANFDYINYIFIPLLIFIARIVDVSIGTLRIVMVSRGKRKIAPLLGFIEVFIWIIAVGKIMQNLDNWFNIVAYSAGFATGNYIGLLIEEKVAMGIVRIQVITVITAGELIENLKNAGFGVTHHEAIGANGKVGILYSIINRADLPKVVKIIRETNPNAFYSIEDVRFVNKRVESIYAEKSRRIRRVRKGK
jgi:uncharacterized protein YebE (UPF0316 family)